MDYIQLLQQRIQSVNDNVILGLIDEEVFRLSDKIIDLNLNQIENSKGFDDKSLKNPFYKGRYSEVSSSIAFRHGEFKPVGGLYDFDFTGDFKRGFNIKDVPKGYEIESFGAYGGDGKTEFFEGYDNMVGLNTENTATIESEVLYYVLEKTFSKLYQ